MITLTLFPLFVRFWFVYFFPRGISAFGGYLMPRTSLQKNDNDTNSISPKVNIIEQLEFELFFFKAAVQYFNHGDTALFTSILISRVSLNSMMNLIR